MAAENNRKPVLKRMESSIYLDQHRRTVNNKNSAPNRVKNRLRGSLYHTAKSILINYIHKYADNKVTADGYFETSNALLADFTAQSSRTIQNHIKKLLDPDMGVLVDKKRDASCFGNNFLIKINPDLICIIEQEIKKEVAESKLSIIQASHRVADNIKNSDHMKQKDDFKPAEFKSLGDQLFQNLRRLKPPDT